MLKRALAAALCLMLVFALQPKTALADTAWPTQVKINGVELNETYPYYINGGGRYEQEPSNWHAHYENGVLTLRGLDVRNCATHGIEASGPNKTVTIELAAETNNIVSRANDASSPNCAIYMNGCNLIIRGSGTLTATGGETSGGSSYGMFINGNLTKSEAGIITAIGGKTTAADNYSYGVFVTGSTDTNSISVTGGSITGRSGEATTGSYGVYLQKGHIDVNGGNITGTGGLVTVGTSNVTDTSFGVISTATDGNITVSNGSITGTGGERENNRTYGVYSGHDIIADSGGIITGKSGTAYGVHTDVSMSYGLRAVNRIAAYSGGTITGKSGGASYESKGVCSNTVSVEGGTLIGVADASTAQNMYGVAVDSTIIFETGRLVGKCNTSRAYGALSEAVYLPSGYYCRTSENAAYTQNNYRWEDQQTYADLRSALPEISFTIEPVENTIVIEGSINSSLTAAASTSFGDEVTLEWYACDENGANWEYTYQERGTFPIPSKLSAGTYYYLCCATCPNARTVYSRVAAVTVNAATHGITVSPATLSFGAANVSYTQPAAQTVTVTYTGNAGSVTLTQPTSAQYNIGTLSRTTLDMTNKTATFTVQPKAGLAIGTYAAPISIVTTPAQASAVTVTPGFTVASIEDLQVSPSASFVQGKAPETKVTVGAGISGFGIGNFVSAEMGPQGGTLALLRDGTDYSKAQGSIIVTLHKSYLDTLVPGVYTLRIHLTNLPGQSYPPYVETTITVKNVNVPKTGDAATPVLWLGLVLLACAGLAVSELLRRRRQNG